MASGLDARMPPIGILDKAGGRIAQRVDGGVDFRAQSAFAAADRLVFAVFFARRKHYAGQNARSAFGVTAFTSSSSAAGRRPAICARTVFATSSASTPGSRCMPSPMRSKKTSWLLKELYFGKRQPS